MLNMKKMAALAMLGALAFNTAYAEDKSAALVNGVSIPQSRVDLAIKAELAQGQADTPELRKSIRENLIKRELMVQEATKLNLDKSPDVLQEMDMAKQSVLINAYLSDYLKKNPITEDMLVQEYEARKAKLGDKEYNARHILVDTEAQAKTIIAQLGKKVKFEKLAAQSKDTGSAAQGGSLGWQVPSNFVAPFAQALQSLKKGEYTKEPVHTQFGWHVIRLDDERALKVPGFEEVKPQLQQRLQQQAIQKAIADLQAKAKVE
ncbi:MAG: peptidylprolyl isomerase [Gallionella sp.]|jgi:peptidyl-prolyl cis-trans isomerase C|nr:peptidylprolyl isomerase [Gallionella sp.]NNM79751.1 peptidylprolyl isomerase [Gallionella sp.]